ncbi:MAG: hypothetical protein LBK03_04280 [Bacteroidales bacterium]|jgi:hypothetical protein|nr:hypothetical protein [Bacteroidales bacterium]
MKKLKLALILAAIILLSGGCKKEIVTYRFTEEDKLKLLPHYIEGKIFTFVNENGDTRKFKVVEFKQGIFQEREYRGLGGNDEYYFFYEYKHVDLIDIETQNKFRISIYRKPINIDLAKENLFKELPSQLLGTIGKSDPFTFGIHFIYDGITSTFTFNGITYVNVYELPQKDVKKDGGMLIDATITYYDEYQGIIGFDDINNHQWRLKNSK